MAPHSNHPSRSLAGALVTGIAWGALTMLALYLSEALAQGRGDAATTSVVYAGILTLGFGAPVYLAAERWLGTAAGFLAVACAPVASGATALIALYDLDLTFRDVPVAPMHNALFWPWWRDDARAVPPATLAALVIAGSALAAVGGWAVARARPHGGVVAARGAACAAVALAAVLLALAGGRAAHRPDAAHYAGTLPTAGVLQRIAWCGNESLWSGALEREPVELLQLHHVLYFRPARREREGGRWGCADAPGRRAFDVRTVRVDRTRGVYVLENDGRALWLFDGASRVMVFRRPDQLALAPPHAWLVGALAGLALATAALVLVARRRDPREPASSACARRLAVFATAAALLTVSPLAASCVRGLVL